VPNARSKQKKGEAVAEGTQNRKYTMMNKKKKKGRSASKKCPRGFEVEQGKKKEKKSTVSSKKRVNLPHRAAAGKRGGPPNKKNLS